MKPVLLALINHQPTITRLGFLLKLDAYEYTQKVNGNYSEKAILWSLYFPAPLLYLGFANLKIQMANGELVSGL